MTSTQNNKAASLSNLSIRQSWAARAIRKSISQIQEKATVIPTNCTDTTHLLPIKETFYTEEDKGGEFEVCIIGAGVAGLFTAMIFDYLNKRFPKLKVKYQILEANEESRLGGRLYTYHFKDKEGKTFGQHDYFDVGAMRFPESPLMKRLFDLFKEIGVEKAPKYERPRVGQLVPYYLNDKKQPAFYNGRRVVGKADPTANDFLITGLPPEISGQGAVSLINSKIKEFTKVYRDGRAEEFWNKLLTEADPYSVRQYLTNLNYDYNTIEFLETLNYGNRWYDQAASEMILEALDFEPNAEWWCVEGGAQQIARKMQQKIKHNQAIQFGKTVTALSYDDEKKKIAVTVRGEKTPKTYDAVFNSAPLGAMQHMQLEGLNLNWGAKQAIRSLGYGASCKIGVRFKNLWWMNKVEPPIKMGGQGRSDLPIRCCVYPSYNIYDKVDEPGVLLVSYTWSQEALRIGSLINRESPAGEEELKSLVIHDLARLHANPEEESDYQRLYNIISDAYLDHYAYNWYANKHSVGGFAYFGPGQFQNMYDGIIRSDGKHIIIGEVASAHHGWVVGALESAVRGVYQFLCRHSERSEAAHEATKAYKKKDGPQMIEPPFGPLPAEYNLTKEDHLPTDAPAKVELQSDLYTGDLARLQVLFEWIRLEQGSDEIQPEKINKSEVRPILGKVAGLLDHRVMVHPPGFQRDYVFIVVPDSWTFLDKTTTPTTQPVLPLSAPPKRQTSSATSAFQGIRAACYSLATPSPLPPSPPTSSSDANKEAACAAAGPSPFLYA
ncbi:L-amino acid oxidase [Fusarium austroafricanum]|uniref:L-amino acid oxidase n=1 Tax=Fusarium austroafricanum TaxID=2364996 RepID=A0A8H4K6Z7_9HYPO|nr:L-amino acid oxidase [Fusarium austroafricanum]